MPAPHLPHPFFVSVLMPPSYGPKELKDARKLTLKIKDHNMMRDTTLGFVELPLASLDRDGAPVSQWYTLQRATSMSKDATGEVFIK